MFVFTATPTLDYDAGPGADHLSHSPMNAQTGAAREKCAATYTWKAENTIMLLFIRGDLQLVQLLPGSLQNNLWCSPSVSLTLDGGANKPYLSSHLSAAGHHGTLMVQLLGGWGGCS